MLKIQNVKYKIKNNTDKITYDDLVSYLYQYISKKYQAKNLRNITLTKKSIDARTEELFFVLQATFNVDNETKLLKNKNITKYFDQEEYIKLKNITKDPKQTKHILVVGMGPSGLFNAYVLSKAGFNVTLIDRGDAIEKRVQDIENFFNNGILKPSSNIQFGEGGAGTFSDGKLGTNISSPYIKYVLETFVQFGAPSNILYEAKPHIGTDVLRKVIINMRKYLISQNVKVLFNTKLIDFDYNVATLCNENETFKITFDKLVLAVGHSAIDIYKLLIEKKVEMSPKNFAVGVRIEHPQELINKSLYHNDYPNLDPAEYKLVVHLENRSVYTFCMCPGGFVVNASSEDGCLVTNGMSNNDRNEQNANSALLVNVNVEDYYQGDILDGAKFLKKYEQLAYNKYGNFIAPVQLVGDFLKGVPSTKIKSVTPTIKPGYKVGTIEDVLPSFVSQSLKEALPLLDQKLAGFAYPDAILTAIETRSSAPIRVERTTDFETSYPNVYAIGEGSGHAGGITTSAIDGIKIALKIINK